MVMTITTTCLLCCICHGVTKTVDLLGSHAMAKQSFVFNNDHLLVLGGDQASFAAEVERATCQLTALNQFGDTVYAPIAPGAAERNKMKVLDQTQFIISDVNHFQFFFLFSIIY